MGRAELLAVLLGAEPALVTAAQQAVRARAVARTRGRVRELLEYAGLVQEAGNRWTLDAEGRPVVERNEHVALAAEVLRVAMDSEALEEEGLQPAAVLAVLRGRGGRYPGWAVEALRHLLHIDAQEPTIVEVRVSDLRAGDLLADHVRHAHGDVLLARGLEISQRGLQCLRNCPVGSVREPVRIVDRDVAGQA